MTEDPSLLESDAAPRGFVRGTARDRGYEHVAKFLLLLGTSAAARVLSGLLAAEVTGIVQEIAHIDSIEQPEARRILEEFGYQVATRELYARGGVAAAEAILRAAFGEECARTWRTRVPAVTPPGPGSDTVDVGELGLLEADHDQLRKVLDGCNDRQLACALAAAAEPVARRMRSCLTPARRAALEAQTNFAAEVLAAERAGTLRALVRLVGRQHPGEERLQQ